MDGAAGMNSLMGLDKGVNGCLSMYNKINERTQELIQSNPHQTPNTKGKDRQIQ